MRPSIDTLCLTNSIAGFGAAFMLVFAPHTAVDPFGVLKNLDGTEWVSGKATAAMRPFAACGILGFATLTLAAYSTAASIQSDTRKIEVYLPIMVAMSVYHTLMLHPI